MIVEICKKEIDELFEEGVNYFNLFLEFSFDLYDEFQNKYDSLLIMSLEGQSRYTELRTFFKKEIFDDFLIVYITRVGTPGIIKVIFNKEDHKFEENGKFYKRFQCFDGRDDS